MKYQITQQSQELLTEWNAEIVEMLQCPYAIASVTILCTEVAKKFNGHIYSIINRNKKSGGLILEERVKGYMCSVCYVLKQNISKLDDTPKPTPVKDAFVLRQKGIDKDKVYNGSEELKAGDYARTTNVAGFVKKVNPKSVIIETLYGGYGGSDAKLIEIKIHRVNILHHLKPFN